MFTGIIGALGTVESITPIEGSDAAYLTLNAGDIVADLEHAAPSPSTVYASPLSTLTSCSPASSAPMRWARPCAAPTSAT